jgi:sulfur dioxygenase
LRFGGRERDRFIELMGNLNLAAPQKIKEAIPANENCGYLAEFD